MFFLQTSQNIFEKTMIFKNRVKTSLSPLFMKIWTFFEICAPKSGFFRFLSIFRQNLKGSPLNSRCFEPPNWRLECIFPKNYDFWENQDLAAQIEKS